MLTPSIILLVIFILILIVLLIYRKKNEEKTFFCIKYLYDEKKLDNLFSKNRYYFLEKETVNFYLFKTDQGIIHPFSKERNGINHYIKDYFLIK